MLLLSDPLEDKLNVIHQQNGPQSKLLRLHDQRLLCRPLKLMLGHLFGELAFQFTHLSINMLHALAVTAFFQRIRKQVQTVHPELGEPIDRVLLLDKCERDESSRNGALRISAARRISSMVLPIPRCPMIRWLCAMLCLVSSRRSSRIRSNTPRRATKAAVISKSDMRPGL